MLCAVLRERFIPTPKDVIVAISHVISFVILVAIMTSYTFSAFLGPVVDLHKDPTFSTFFGSASRTMIAGLLVLSFSYASSLGTAVLANPLAVLLGRCSFSIYLLHDAIFYWLIKLGLFVRLQPRVATILSSGVIVGIAALSYYLIEAPLRLWFKCKIMQFGRSENSKPELT
jgi:peptidoglycan/LPS O-acetylase OafA/YrhL